MYYQGHTGAPAGPAAGNLQPWFPAWALGPLFRRAHLDGMARGGGWGCHQPHCPVGAMVPAPPLNNSKISDTFHVVVNFNRLFLKRAGRRFLGGGP